MAIVRMSRLKLAGLRSERERLLRELQKLGCVELESPATPEEAQEWLTMTARDEADDSRLRAAKTKLTAAQIALGAGCDMIIMNSADPMALYDAAEGRPVGTRFHAGRCSK